MTSHKFTLYVVPGSSRCTSVMVAAKFAKVSYDLKILSMAGTKTPEYLQVHPLGKVPGAQTTDGPLYESNAISRYVARIGKSELLGTSSRDHALVDQFLDTIRQDIAGLVRVAYAVFGFDFLSFTREEFEKGVAALVNGLKFVDSHLKDKKFLVGSHLTLADIVLVCDLVNAYRFVFTEDQRKALPHLTKYFYDTVALHEFVEVIGKVAKPDKRPFIKFTEKSCHSAPSAAPKKEEPAKKAAAPAAKKTVEKHDDDEIKEEKKPEPKFPDSEFNFIDFKVLITNSANKKDAVDFLLKNFDKNAFSIWWFRYDKLPSEGKKLFLTRNFLTGFMSRSEIARKYTVGTIGIYGEGEDFDVKGIWMWRGVEELPVLADHSQWEYFQKRKLDMSNPEDVQLLVDYWTKSEEEKDVVEGKTLQQYILFK